MQRYETCSFADMARLLMNDTFYEYIYLRTFVI